MYDPIDFRKLLQEERQRVRKELQAQYRQKQSKEYDLHSQSDTDTVPISPKPSLEQHTVTAEDSSSNYLEENDAVEDVGGDNGHTSNERDVEGAFRTLHVAKQEENVEYIPQPYPSNPLSKEFTAQGFLEDSSLMKMVSENPFTQNSGQIPPTLLNNVLYEEHFLSEGFASLLLQRLQQLPHDPPYRSRSFRNQGHQSSCESIHWTRLPHAQRNVALVDLQSSSTPTLPSPVSDLLKQLCQVFLQLHIFPSSHPPNHVLINEYQPHEGIMPHTDGPSYYPKTATISIGGGDVLFKFTHRQSTHTDPVMEIRLSGQGSLIVFQDEAYIDFCHSIQDRLLDDHEVVRTNSNLKCINFKPNGMDPEEVQMYVVRGYRISLTFRHKYHHTH